MPRLATWRILALTVVLYLAALASTFCVGDIGLLPLP